jgi:hypothetical protein
MSKYNKAIVAAVGGFISALELYYDVLPQWAQLLVFAATAFGVYKAENK